MKRPTSSTSIFGTPTSTSTNATTSGSGGSPGKTRNTTRATSSGSTAATPGSPTTTSSRSTRPGEKKLKRSTPPGSTNTTTPRTQTTPTHRDPPAEADPSDPAAAAVRKGDREEESHPRALARPARADAEADHPAAAGPAAADDPAARDVWCAAPTEDWSSKSALCFRIKPETVPLKLSVSFLDANFVAYTAWRDLVQGWQDIRLPLDAMKPNPYFQPPFAKTGHPIDVSRVTEIGFAPQSQPPGRLTITPFFLV
mmetsp:Transcript_1530/g.5264  ORF Transcript_1530/g.5264 Transcript_1530/m.5264 type:complete len:255 (-) Transcript_1530:194-958(-)